jgi:hypothetical protein
MAGMASFTHEIGESPQREGARHFEARDHATATVKLFSARSSGEGCGSLG